MKKQNIDPPRARLLIVPAYGDRSFLCDKEGIALHTTALVGSIPGPGNLALLYQYQRPVFCHENEECKRNIGETFMGRGLVPFTMTGNEGYAPCHGCGLPVAGPSSKESSTHPPLPIPADIAEMFYGSQRRYPFQPAPCPGQTRKKKKPAQLSLFEE
jgi:hypothetical protein